MGINTISTETHKVKGEQYKDYIADIRQINFWNEYLDQKAEFYSNAYRSALKAGYSEVDASRITTYKFFKKRMRRLGLLDKAEKVLNSTLSMNIKGTDGKPQADLLRIKTDVAKHITKTLGKDEGYSERSEITGKDGQEFRISEIIFNPPVVNPKSDES